MRCLGCLGRLILALLMLLLLLLQLLCDVALGGEGSRSFGQEFALFALRERAILFVERGELLLVFVARALAEVLLVGGLGISVLKCIE